MPLIRSAGGAQRVFLASAAAFLLVAPFPSSAGWRVFFLLVALGALAWQAMKGLRPLELALVPRPFALAACAWGALAIASLAWSVDAEYTQQELRRELLYGALAFVVFFAGTRAARELHLWLLMLLTTTLALAAGEWLRLLFPALGLFRHASMGPGPFSTHLVVIAPLVVVALWPAPGGMASGARRGMLLALLLALAGIGADSRILWPALIACATAAFLAFAAQLPAGHPSRKPARRALAAAFIVLPVLMAVSIEYKMRLYPSASSGVDSLILDERPLIWRTAVRAVEAHPWIGHGYGREIIGAQLRAQLARAGQPAPYSHGHNVFIDTAIELGAVGVAAFAALFASLAFAFTRARRREGGAMIAIAGLALVAGYLVKNLTDDFFFRPNSLVFWAVAGMMLGFAARRPLVGR
jgi:O-antigen ligase